VTTAQTAPPAPQPAAPRLWYMIEGGRYDGSEPPFLDPRDHPWLRTLEDNWETIRDEIQVLLARHESRLEPYFNRAMFFPPRSWKTMGFYFWTWRIHKNCRECPKTTAILESIPNMTAGSLSVLEPHSNINPHQGDTNAIVRTHLGLDIPAPLPACGLQVGREIRGWEEGKALPFIDAMTHSSWNQSDRRRLVLIVDVMRPEFAARTGAICRHVLASTFLQVVYQRFAVLNRMPGSLKFAIHAVARAFLRPWMPLQRLHR
jgi:aspartyl/asparaginyl beta-hydroxylase (cupin superfamily)